MDLSFIGEIDFCYTTSFIHTSRIKYDVEFRSSNVVEIVKNLKLLIEKIESGNFNDTHVGYDFTISDVKHIINLISRTINAYSTEYSIENPPSIKLSILINQVKQKSTISAKELSKEVIKEILSPINNNKFSKKEQKKEEAEKLSLQRAINHIKKSKKI